MARQSRIPRRTPIRVRARRARKTGSVAAVLLLGATPGLAQDTVRATPDEVRAPEVGRLTRVVDAVPLRGGEIRLRLALRAELPEMPACGRSDRAPDPAAAGSGEAWSGRLSGCEPGAYGWLRIDGAPAAGPGDELRTLPVASAGWTVEEIRATVPSDALEIHFGVLLAGEGAMWADDVQLAQRREDGTWRRLYLENADCESVLEGGRPAAWGGIDAPYRARIDRETPYEGTGAIRIERTAPGPERVENGGGAPAASRPRASDPT
ncbi:MAG: hypothetical protein R6X22_00205 [Gemmatimonadota bacterium]